MIERILDLSEKPAKIHLSAGLLVVESGETKAEIPVAETAVVLLAHPHSTITQGALAALAKAGGVAVVADEKWMPAAMLLPLEGHFVQGERFVKQAEAPLPRRKRLWQAIVKAKIRSQGRLLAHCFGTDSGLANLAKEVRSGDPDGCEARAARHYWPLLFGPEFRRERMHDDQNRYLNYGYAVLRAACARAICAVGLHPSLGVHHHNRYDAFRLADDLMEPWRPLVDHAAYGLWREFGPEAPLDKTTKPRLIAAVTGRWDAEGENRALFDILGRAARRLASALIGETEEFVVPEVERFPTA